MTKPDKKTIGVYLLIAAVFAAGNLGFNLSQFGQVYTNYEIVLDTDKLENGNYLLCHSTYRAQKSQKGSEEALNRLIEITPEGDIVWEYQNVHALHEACQMPNGNILIADTGYDRVVEVNYTTKQKQWEWLPAEINWTEVNSQWGPDHFYNNPIEHDWSHLNDVDFYQYSTWNACLISIRDFDMVVLVNATADMKNPNQAENIVWYYSTFNNHSAMFHQHNPDILSNGNLIVCDSQNKRVTEINRTTKQVVWTYTDDKMAWVRDADELPNGNLLISDSGRVFEINKTTKEIVWHYGGDLLSVYEADILENGNILIGGGETGVAYEIDPNTKKEVWGFGDKTLRDLVYINSALLMALAASIIVMLVRRNKKRGEINTNRKIGLILASTVFLASVGMFIWAKHIITPIISFFAITMGGA